jgi:hypothetical protein
MSDVPKIRDDEGEFRIVLAARSRSSRDAQFND